MKVPSIARKHVTVASIALVVVGASVATAVAGPSPSNGDAQVQMINVAQTDATSTSSVAWVPLPEANITMTVPPNATRLVNARFAAESNCTGASNALGYCSVRIVAVNAASGAVVELDPASGTDFAFDSDRNGTTNDMWESHAIERSRRLPAGTYKFRVEYVVVNDPTVSFRLDDWHFTVETSV